LTKPAPLGWLFTKKITPLRVGITRLARDLPCEQQGRVLCLH
jgi:hypothetical protein